MAILNRLCAGLALALCGLAAAAENAEPAERAAEADLKAAYAYNFVVLSSWPEETPRVLQFCVAGARPGATAFHVLDGKVARDRVLSVVNVPEPGRAHDCSVLYVPPSESPRLPAWLAAVSRGTTLTISDGADERGAIVNLRIIGRQIVFDLDTQAAASARLQLSSQLIKLAATRR
jgi:hypothetical protein